jgi:hypothetical protein
VPHIVQVSRFLLFFLILLKLKDRLTREKRKQERPQQAEPHIVCTSFPFPIIFPHSFEVKRQTHEKKTQTGKPATG